MNRKRAFATLFVVVTLCGALAFWRYWKAAQTYAHGRPVPQAWVEKVISPTNFMALQGAEKVTLYSLYPEYSLYSDYGASLQEAQRRLSSFRPPLHTTELFHGYPVLGKVVLSASQTNAMLRAFYDGIPQPGGFDGRAACFSPGHSFRVEQAGKITDFVICFRCGQFLINPKQQYGRSIYITKSPQPVFDALLKSRAIALEMPGE